MKDFYVDDLITTSNTKEEIFAIKEELQNHFKRFRWELHKWCTNADSKIQGKIDLIATDNEQKILGMLWCKKEDSFEFVSEAKPEANLMKREFLSGFSKIYDPMGFITLITILLRTAFQELWGFIKDWDDTVPNETLAIWNRYVKEVDK
jgi:Pao retrotransposon peptidase